MENMFYQKEFYIESDGCSKECTSGCIGNCTKSCYGGCRGKSETDVYDYECVIL